MLDAQSSRRTNYIPCFAAEGLFGVATLLIFLPANAAAEMQTTTQTLSLSVSPSGSVSVNGNVSLTAANTRFGDYGGNLTVNYWARTSSGGSGSVTVQAGSDFVPSGGPGVGLLTYNCSGATMGSACSGTQTIQTTSQTSVVTLPGAACTGGGGACSSQDSNSVQLQFRLPNKPAYKTGTYVVQLTFTISTI